MKNQTILIGLNELNFSFIQHYIDEGHLPSFKKLFDNFGYHLTESEKEYRLLEPWIQWVTVSTGKTYEQHGVFRLGDIVDRPELEQIFEKIEKKGYSVGAVSPFNVANRLKHPAFFAPDPWTKTKAVGSSTLVGLSNAVSQAVNDNAHGKLTPGSIIALIKGLVKYSTPKDGGFYLSKFIKIKSEVGVKALVLDKLLADTFIKEWKNHQPSFSNLFLNSGAHLQHHYMFNSRAYKGEFANPEWYCPKNQDPLFEILKVYDSVIERLMQLPARLVFATGLSQKPHKHLTYYWRIKEHSLFLKYIGIDNFTEAIPRMSRDFMVKFDNVNEAVEAQKVLESYKSEKDQVKIFTVDNRGTSLFVELTYPSDIDDKFHLEGRTRVENFKQYISFVAIKNGEHDETGYVIDTGRKIKEKKIPLAKLHDLLVEDFK